MRALLTPTQVAEILGITTITLARWRSQTPKRLPYVQVSSRAIRYRPDDVEKYIDRRLCGGRS